VLKIKKTPNRLSALKKKTARSEKKRV